MLPRQAYDADLRLLPEDGWIRPGLNWSIVDMLGFLGSFGGPRSASRLYGSSEPGKLVAQRGHLGVGARLLP